MNLIFKGKDQYGFERNFNLYDIVDLFVKVKKDVTVYSWPVKSQKYIWWKYKAGDFIGKIDIFLSEWDMPLDGGMSYDVFKRNRLNLYDNTMPKGLWFVFKTTNGQSYYVQFEAGLIDWDEIQKQLTSARRREMGFFERYFDQLEEAVVNKLKATAQAAKEGLAIGAGIGLVILAIYGIFKKVQHNKTIEEYKAIAREVGRGSK
jgi:hypothetical protein